MIRLSALLAALAALTISAPAAALQDDADGSRSVTDPYFHAQGSWGQDGDDQWALKRIGLDDPQEVWRMLGAAPSPVIVAVIDTGVDWNHLDLSWGDFWVNDGETIGDGLDNDGNGYIDDKIGWDFFADNNRPWDYDGHGTFTAGLIAAQTNNGVGITGVNPHARIMVLKGVNNFGRTRASYLARAIAYAVDNGARIINLSVGGESITTIETAALDYAAANEVLIFVAAGNENQNLADYGPASHPAVVTVAATAANDRRSAFSNWGPQVKIAAPGEDILSLRARKTDTMRNAGGEDYAPNSAYVGYDRRYYHASGTSFSAPFVAGAASLLLSRSPELTAEQVKRILLQSARDIETPGVDQLTGYGLLDVRAALVADPDYYVVAEIAAVRVAQGTDGPVAEILGAADANAFGRARIEIGAGEEPQSWKPAGVEIGRPVRDDVLAIVPASEFAGAPVWTLRLVVEHENGGVREARYRLQVG